MNNSPCGEMQRIQLQASHLVDGSAILPVTGYSYNQVESLAPNIDEELSFITIHAREFGK